MNKLLRSCENVMDELPLHDCEHQSHLHENDILPVHKKFKELDHEEIKCLQYWIQI